MNNATSITKALFHDYHKEMWDASNSVHVPRILPLLLFMLDSINGHKGNPARTYIDLWLHADNSAFVTNSDEGFVALRAGYSGHRGLRTWREHIRFLAKIGVIRVAKKATDHKKKNGRPSNNGEAKHIFLVHPTIAAHRLARQCCIKDTENLIRLMQSYNLDC